MKNYIVCACLTACLSLTACGGGGGSSDDNPLGLSCSEAKPLLCRDVAGCCDRGLPYYCDGYCYGNERHTCVETDVCTFIGPHMNSFDVNVDGVESAGIATEK